MKYKFLLIFILFLSFLVRLLGVNFNLPYIEFTDELTVGQNAFHFAQTGDFKYFHFLYPPLHTYFQGLTIFLYSKLRGISVADISQSELYLLLRTTVALLGWISVFLVYKLTKIITKDKLSAIFAAAIFGFNLTHVAYSQLVKNEIPALFLGLITLLLTLKILEEGRFRWYLLAGFFCGLTFATAYPWIIFVFPIIISHLIFEYQTRKFSFSLLFSPKLFLGLLGVGFGFATGNPIFVFDNQLFWDRINFSRQLIAALYPHPLPTPAWRWYLLYLWRFGLYYPVFLLVTGGIVVGLKRYRGYSLVLLSFIMGYGLIIFLNNNYYTDRLSLPLTPFLIIFAGIFLTYLFRLFLDICKRYKFFARVTATLLLVLFFSLLFFRVGVVSYQMAQPTPLQVVEKWFDKNVPKDSSIFLTANAGKMAFSPNEMEKKYRFFYYYPELMNRPVRSLSLSFDYIILYWPGNLPPKWVEDLNNEFNPLVEFSFPSLPKILDFLNANAQISNPFMNARSPFGSGAVIYKLPLVPEDNYVIFTRIEGGEEQIKGEFIFVKGSAGQKTEVLYSTDFVLTSETGSQKYTEYFKPIKNIQEYQFNVQSNNLVLNLDKPFKDIALYRILENNLKDRLNLGTRIRGNILGLDGSDFCDLGSSCHPSGSIDFHIRLSGIEKEIRRIVVLVGEDTWMGPFNGAYADLYFKEKEGILDLYFEPFRRFKDDANFKVIIYYNDGTYSLLSLIF